MTNFEKYRDKIMGIDFALDKETKKTWWMPRYRM